MLELCCPTCGRANAVADAAVLARTRCAECAGRLDEDRPVRYLVGDGGLSRGLQEHRDLVNGVAAGTLTPDMLLSEEKGPWFRAGERSDLFPRTRRAVFPAPRRTPRPGQRLHAVPGHVAAMAALDIVAGVLILLLALFAFVLSSSLGVMGKGLPIVLIVALVGGGHFTLAGGLRRRSMTARNIQLVLAGLGGVGLLLRLHFGEFGGVVLVGGILVAVPFLLLLSGESSAWFRGSSADA